MKIVKEVKMICIQGKTLGFYINGRLIRAYQVDENINEADMLQYYNDKDLWL